MTQSLEILKKESKNSGEINWVTSTFMVLFHVGAIIALFFFSWKAFFVAMILWWVATSLGIGMCYHRLLTHRGYKVPKWLEYTLTIFATLALEGGPFSGWPRTAFTTNFPIRKAIRIRPWTAPGGRTWAGSSPASPCITTPPRFLVTFPTLPRPISTLDQQKLLRPDDRSRPDSARRRRRQVRPLGNFPAHGYRLALHLAGEFRHAQLGHAPFSNSRSIHQ